MNKAIHLTAPAHATDSLLQIVTSALAAAGAAPSLPPHELIRLGRFRSQTALTFSTPYPPVLFSVWVHDRRVQNPDLPPPPSSTIRIFPRPKMFPVSDSISAALPGWASRLLPLTPAASRHFVAVDKPGGVPVHETMSNAVQVRGWREAFTRRTADNALAVHSCWGAHSSG